jgi:hypothetical protein
LDDPPPNRSSSDFTVLAIGEISQRLPAPLPPPLEDFVDVLMDTVASSCLGKACGVALLLLPLELFGREIDALRVPAVPLDCEPDPSSWRM